MLRNDNTVLSKSPNTKRLSLRAQMQYHIGVIPLSHFLFFFTYLDTYFQSLRTNLSQNWQLITEQLDNNKNIRSTIIFSSSNMATVQRCFIIQSYQSVIIIHLVMKLSKSPPHVGQ